MYTPQFTVTAAAASVSSSNVRGRRTIPLTHDQCRRTTSTPTTTTSDQTIRCARISTAPEGRNNGQYNGNNPHMAYAATPNRTPRRESDMPPIMLRPTP
ncbi:hypothetical protein GCM10009677_61800 [Sphaerisporangium rubeum]